MVTGSWTAPATTPVAASRQRTVDGRASGLGRRASVQHLAPARLCDATAGTSRVSHATKEAACTGCSPTRPT